MQIYHIVNRAVEGRKIFRSTEDHLRFAHNLRDFNNREITFLSYPKRRRKSEVSPQIEGAYKIVDLLCWCEMRNHFHLMSQDCIEGGSSIYAKKLTVGYAMYFNSRHHRRGTLFQGRTKVTPITAESHWLHLPFYILTNPLSLMLPNWKTRGIRNIKMAFEFLEHYRWSALPDLLGKSNFPGTVNRELFFDLFDLNERRLKQELMEWLSNYDKNKLHVSRWGA